MLKQIAALRRTDVEDMADRYGLDMNDEDQRLQAAEEVLAFMAQENPKLGFVKRAIGAIRTWLRNNIPMLADMELTDAEIIRNFIMPARAFVERGVQAGREMAAAQYTQSAPFFSQGLLTPAPLGPKPSLQVVEKIAASFQKYAKSSLPITVVRNPSEVQGLEVEFAPGGSAVNPAGGVVKGLVGLLFVGHEAHPPTMHRQHTAAGLRQCRGMHEYGHCTR